jgi:tetratricopeptide (TPR) repeat protein
MGEAGGIDAMRLACVFLLGMLLPCALEAKYSVEGAAQFHFSLAQSYASDGDSGRAIEEYKLTLVQDPDSPLVYTRLAAEYIKKGVFSSAVEACQSALKLDPEDIDARLILAGIYASRRHFQEAVAEYQHILRKNPHHEEATIYQSEVLMQQEQVQKAVVLLQSFLKNRTSFLAYYYLGRAQQYQRHFKKAEFAFKRALEIKPGFQQAIIALGYLYEENQKVAEAISLYERSFQDYPEPLVAVQLSALYLKLGKYKASLPYLEFLKRSDPEDLNSSFKLALVYMELKEYEKSISVFQSILAKSPESDRVHYYLGSLFEESQRIPEAISELKSIRSDSSLYTEATLHLVHLLKGLQQFEEAREWMKHAISLSPDTASFYLLQANLEEDRKQTESAIKILESVEKKFSENEKIHYYLGSLYDQQGNWKQALDKMETVVRLNPKNVDALNYLGYTWTQQRIRLNDAEILLKAALRLRPESGYVQDSWGWYLFVRGRVQESIVQLEKALKGKPHESAILEHLGDAYLKCNLREKALTQYQDALKYSRDAAFKKRMSEKAENLTKQIHQLRLRKP